MTRMGAADAPELAFGGAPGGLEHGRDYQRAMTPEQLDEALAGDETAIYGAVPTYAVDLDYPYDPNLRIEELRDLDKLCALPNRRQAQELYDLWLALEQKWVDATYLKREAAREKRKHAKHVKDLQELADAAFDNKYGPKAKALAFHMLVDETQHHKPRRTDQQSLEEFAAELRRLRQEDD